MLARTAKEAMQATDVKRHDDVPLQVDRTGDEYAAESIVHYKKDHEGARYLIRWYSYRPADDTWEPALHIPHHFIQRYLGRQRREKQRSPQVNALI